MKYYQKLAILLGLIWGFSTYQRIVIAIIMSRDPEGYEFFLYKGGPGLLDYRVCLGLWHNYLGNHRRQSRPEQESNRLLHHGGFRFLVVYRYGAQGLGQMLWVRGALGFFEGGPWARPMHHWAKSPAEKRAMLVSFPSAGAMVIGTVLGPIIAVKLIGGIRLVASCVLHHIHPSFILGVVCAFVMREPASVVERIRLRKAGQKQVVTQEGHKAKLEGCPPSTRTWLSPPLTAYRVWHGFGYTRDSAALFLTKVHNLSMDAVGLVISASGLGGFIGMVGVSRVSDSIGRKPAIMISGFLCCLLGLGILAAPVRSSMAALAVLFFFWAMFGRRDVSSLHGPLANGGSAAPSSRGTAVGVPTAIGEILGAAALPALPGFLADKFVSRDPS